MQDTTLERGPQMLADRYALGDVIGKGGMGLVYRAWDCALHREVAVKVLHQMAMEDEVNRARFSSEATTLAHLDHPGLSRSTTPRPTGTSPTSRWNSSTARP